MMVERTELGRHWQFSSFISFNFFLFQIQSLNCCRCGRLSEITAHRPHSFLWKFFQLLQLLRIDSSRQRFFFSSPLLHSSFLYYVEWTTWSFDKKKSRVCKHYLSFLWFFSLFHPLHVFMKRELFYILFHFESFFSLLLGWLDIDLKLAKFLLESETCQSHRKIYQHIHTSHITSSCSRDENWKFFSKILFEIPKILICLKWI